MNKRISYGISYDSLINWCFGRYKLTCMCERKRFWRYCYRNGRNRAQMSSVKSMDSRKMRNWFIIYDLAENRDEIIDKRTWTESS